MSASTVYEEASADEENGFLELATEITARMNRPRGWSHHRKRGRPLKKRKGRPEEFHWQGRGVVLLLKTYLDVDYRLMASHLKARPELVKRLGLPRAPSKSQIHASVGQFPPSWIARLNRAVLREFKKTRATVT